MVRTGTGEAKSNTFSVPLSDRERMPPAVHSTPTWHRKEGREGILYIMYVMEQIILLILNSFLPLLLTKIYTDTQRHIDRHR